MHGLVSLLDQEHSATVERLWAELETECGLTGIKVTPFAHFSWLIAEDFDWERLGEALAEIAIATKPFIIRTTGLALFTGEHPVVYIPVVERPARRHLGARGCRRYGGQPALPPGDLDAAHLAGLRGRKPGEHRLCDAAPGFPQLRLADQDRQYHRYLRTNWNDW